MSNDFEFFVGTWTSIQRRLRKILAGCDEWDEFPGVTRCWSLLDGAGNVDEVEFPTRGFAGVTLRLYDRSEDAWSLYWAGGPTGLSLPPVVGRFDDDGIGTFTCADVHDGRPVTVRYQWSGITPESCHWEQAFCIGQGAGWETNWTADFTRTS